MQRSRLTGWSIVAMLAWTHHADAGTYYWGGGSADITDGTPLPVDIGNLSGTWDTTTKNWAVDAAGSSYTNWPSDGEAHTAVFGQGVTLKLAGSVGTVTLGTAVTANRLEFLGPNITNFGQINLTAATPTLLTLNGDQPKIYIYGGTNWRADLLANVSLAGSQGVIVTGNSRTLNVYGDTTALTGTIDFQSSATGVPSTFMAGSNLVATNLLVRAGTVSLRSSSAAANTAFPDNLVFRLLGNTAVFDPRAYRGTTASTESIGKIALDYGYGNLDVRYASAGSGEPRGTYILSDPVAGIDRGPYGNGMIGLHNDGVDPVTEVVVSHGVAPGILPWAMSNRGQLVELDANNTLRQVANEGAPTDVALWEAGKDYRATNTLTGTLDDLTLNSLTANLASKHITLTINDGKTLTLTRGLVGIQRNGSTCSLTLAGGTVTTPADTLYVTQGTISADLNISSALAGSFDLVLGGNGGKTVLSGSAPNTFSGTTYVSGCGLVLSKPTASAPTIPGDLVVVGGSVGFGSSTCQEQIARYANVTIEQYGRLYGGGNGGTQDFGGIVTLNGGTWLGHYANSHHAFDGPGFGLRFNGGVFGVNSTTTGTGNYYLLTNVSYSPESDRQALFENIAGTQLLRLTEAGKGAAVRTFDIADSAALPVGVPEMVIDMILREISTSENAGLTKTGSGTLAAQRYTANLTGAITVNGGTLLANATATSEGSAVGTGAVAVNATGTLGGLGVAGAVALNAGGSLDPGAVTGETGTFTANDDVTFGAGSVWHVDLAGEATADQLVCLGDLALDGTVEPAAADGYAIPTIGEWLIGTCAGTISGEPTAPIPFSVKVRGDEIWLTKGSRGTMLLIR